jgi:SAM-dependent methyltransferase
MPMTKSEEYWNQFYSFNKAHNPLFIEFLSDNENSFLKSQLPRLKKGKALDIAIGNGNNSKFLAQNQFEILGVDNSEIAISKTKEKLTKENLTAEFKKIDIELHIFGLLQFDTIIMNYYKPQTSRVYDELIRSLKHGGTILIESFLIDEMNEILGPEDSYKNMFYKPNEVLKNLNSLRILFYNEGIIDGKHRVQCLAQKPFDKDIEKYNLFNMSRPKDSQHDTKTSAQMKLAESLFKKKD